MNEALLAKIKATAATPTNSEKYAGQGQYGYCPGEGGGYDDAYGEGLEDGEILYARELLKMIEK